jgi:peroxiredoxin
MSVLTLRRTGAVHFSMLVALFAAVAACLASPVHAAPDPNEIAEINAIIADPARAGEAVPRIKKVLEDPSLEPGHRDYLHQLLMQAMLVSETPTSEIVKEVESIGPKIGSDTRTIVLFYGQAAQALVQHGEQPDRAIEYAMKAAAAADRDERFRGVGGEILSILGQAHLQKGNTDAAISTLNESMSSAIDTQLVLYHLGRAYEKKGQSDPAINAYVRSLAVFGREDTSAAAPLRALYMKKHGGSLKGLDAMLKTASKASIKRIALDTRSYTMDAPKWTLPDLDGGTVQLSDFKGKVVVLDFWGSWCGPCRQEMPHIQKLHDQYKDKGVAVIGINWEKNNTAEARLKAAKSFVAQYGYTFPMAIDHDRQAVTDYAVEGFPSVYLVDKTGMIRYRNVGFDPKIAEVLTAQIESLLE